MTERKIDPNGYLKGKHKPTGDCTNKTEQVVQDAKDAMESGDVARALKYLIRFADRGVNNHTTEELLRDEIESQFEDQYLVTGEVAEVALRELDGLVRSTAHRDAEPYGHQPPEHDDPLQSDIFRSIKELEDVTGQQVTPE
jgi:hypothetical protein